MSFKWMRSFFLFAVAGAVLVGFCFAGDTPPDAPPAPDDTIAPVPAPPGTPPLPADLNSASLRVSAIDTIYEMDLSIDQLKYMSVVAVGAGAADARTPAQPNPDIADALNNFQNALLTASDDQLISDLRNKVTDVVNSSDSVLDDQVKTTDSGSQLAPQIVRQLKASQIAAFIAMHADEVPDPVEMMMTSLDQIRSLQESDPTGNDPAVALEVANTIKNLSTTINQLVTGSETSQVSHVREQVVVWVHSAVPLSDDAYTAQRPTIADQARKIVGDVPPMLVISHWMEEQVAILLSNPQLPDAINAVLATRPAGK